MQPRWMMPAAFAAVVLTGTGCGPTYPNCDEDRQCHEGEYCVNGQCQQCRDDQDCAAGEACNQGACEPIAGYCQSSGDCPEGQECRDNRCVAPFQATQDLPPPAAPTACEMTPIYFGFDADELDTSARNAIQANLTCFRERGGARLHLTGHCDPRGTEEYNLALGDRRARAVRQYLSSLGLEDGSISSSSMGEEMARGSDDSSYSRDRRVDLTPQ